MSTQFFNNPSKGRKELDDSIPKPQWVSFFLTDDSLITGLVLVSVGDISTIHQNHKAGYGCIVTLKSGREIIVREELKEIEKILPGIHEF